MVSGRKRLFGAIAPLLKYSVAMLIVGRIGDLANLYVGMFLVPDVISTDELGGLLPLTQMALIVGVPLNVAMLTARKYVNVFLLRGELGKVRALLRDAAVLTFGLSALVAAVLVSCAGFFLKRLKYDDIRIVWLVVAVGIVSCWMPVVRLIAQGLRAFRTLIISRLVEPCSRLILMLLLIGTLQVYGYLLATLFTAIVVVMLFLLSFRKYFRGTTPSVSYRAEFTQMARYLAPMALMYIVKLLQYVLEPLIIRQRLPTIDSAAYYVVHIFGSIPLALGPAILSFFFAMVSERHEKRKSTFGLHVQALVGILIVGGGLSLAFALFGGRLLALRASWAQYVDYSHFIWQVALVATLNVLIECHLMHECACLRFKFLRFLVPVILLQVGGLYGLMGWPFFKPFLPGALWSFVDGFVVRDLQFILLFILGGRLLLALLMGGQIARRGRRARAGSAPEIHPPGDQDD